MDAKSQAENNRHHLREFIDDPWYPAIWSCHEKLERLTPGYSIDQIKEKFGSLRYYTDQGECPESVWLANFDRHQQIITWAEAWVDGYEYAKREARQRD